MKTSLAQAASLAFLLLATLPLGLSAQQKARTPAAPAAAQPPAEVQEWLAELEEIHGKLEEIQTQALQDRQLSAAQAELGGFIKEVMDRIDPTLAKSMARMRDLESEAATARRSGDQARLQALGAEAQQVERQFEAAQRLALQQPEVTSHMATFQQSLQRKMLEVSPEAEGLIARLRDLEGRLSTAMEGTTR